MAYDWLKHRQPSRAAKEYLRILHLAARENETAVDDALRTLIDQDEPITFETVEAMVSSQEHITAPTEVAITEVDLATYDVLLSVKEVAAC
jgi:hypothetical protein